MKIERYKLYTLPLFATIWVALCWGFVADELVPPLHSLDSAIGVMVDGVILVLGILTLRKRSDIAILASFLVISLSSKLVNHGGMIYYLNGFRDFIGVLFMVPILRFMLTSKYAERFKESVDHQLLIFLRIQAVCLVWQFLRYGAGDWGGGSMGNGFSGTISTLIYITSFYLITKKWDKDANWLTNITANKELLLLLLPTFLNETKISFVFLVLYAVLLYPINTKNLIRQLMLLPVYLIALIGVGYIYTTTTNQEADSFSAEFFNNYLIGEDLEDLAELAVLVDDGDIETENLWVVDLPRIGKLLLMDDALRTTNGKMLLGAGIGQFKGFSMLGTTPFVKKYKWLLQGSVPWLFALIIQLGLCGAIWFVCSFCVDIWGGKSTGWASLNARIFIMAIMAVILLYSDIFRNVAFDYIIFYIALSGTILPPSKIWRLRLQ